MGTCYGIFCEKHKEWVRLSKDIDFLWYPDDLPDSESLYENVLRYFDKKDFVAVYKLYRSLKVNKFLWKHKDCGVKLMGDDREDDKYGKLAKEFKEFMKDNEKMKFFRSHDETVKFLNDVVYEGKLYREHFKGTPIYKKIFGFLK